MDRVTAQSRARVVRVARYFIETHCGEHCVDWEGLIPTHDITRYPAAATVCFNKVCGVSLVAKRDPSKFKSRVRFSHPAPQVL